MKIAFSKCFQAGDGGPIHKKARVFSKNGYEWTAVSNFIMKKYKHYISNNCTSISIGNHMISRAIWDKSARVNFSKTNKIARARRAMYVLIIHIQKLNYAASRCQTYRRFRTLTFHSLLKHCGVSGVCKSRYCF